LAIKEREEEEEKVAKLSARLTEPTRSLREKKRLRESVWREREEEG
jgi:hypothetical protein